jgi:hypothetical protein
MTEKATMTYVTDKTMIAKIEANEFDSPVLVARVSGGVYVLASSMPDKYTLTERETR